jgi:hypothetical protein
LLAPGYLNDVVGVAQIGSAYIAPKEVIMSDAVEGYVPPLAFPVYRTVPEGPVTREAMDALADRLGVGPERTYYDSTALSDPRWNLTFHHGDIACFTLNNLRFDQEIMKQLEAGRMIKPVSPDSARKSADEILAASGYAEGVEFADTGVRTSVTGPFAGRPSSTYVLSSYVSYRATVGGVRLINAGVNVDVDPEGQVVGFSHLVQKAELAGEVKLRPVAEALADLRAGRGQCPPQASDLSSVAVESIDIAYYAAPVPLGDSYYKPIYVFHVRMGDGKPGEWLLSAFDAACNTSPSATTNAWPKPEPSPQSEAAATATTTLWLRPSSASTRPNSSESEALGGTWTTWNTRLSSGSTGSTTVGSSNPSATYRQQNWKTCTIVTKLRPKRPDSNN